MPDCLSDLRQVGPEKPLGCLPISTIVDACGEDPLRIKEELTRKGLKVIILSPKESSISTGAFYAYDENVLGSLLAANEKILKAKNWPTEPELFVRHLKIKAEQKTDLFDFIADAFNDKNNPGRKNFPTK